MTAHLNGVISLVATALAAVATAISALDGDGDLVPFFALLTIAGAAIAWATRAPVTRSRRMIAGALAGAWVVAAIWIGGLLVMYQATCACTTVAPIAPDATYVGLPATAYHLAAMYLGGALIVVAVFGGWRRQRV